MLMTTEETIPEQPGENNPQATPTDHQKASPVIINSSELLKGRREVWIAHGEEMYRLQLTPSGKLYLTK